MIFGMCWSQMFWNRILRHLAVFDYGVSGTEVRWPAASWKEVMHEKG